MAEPSEAAASFFGATSNKRLAIDASAGIRPKGTLRVLRAGVWSPDDVLWAEKLVDRYENTTLSLIQPNGNDSDANVSSFLIPKTIHFIWLGSKPIPQQWSPENNVARDPREDHTSWNACMGSWSKHHPLSSGWEIKLWTESNVQSTFLDDDAPRSMSNGAAYEYAVSDQNYGLASDILRLEILWHFGGVYADIDYLCTASVDFLHSSLTFYCGASNVGCIEINNGLMGCTRQHVLVKRMMDDINKWFDGISTTKASQPRGSPSVLSSFLDEQSAESLSKAIALTHEDVIRHTGPGLITRTLTGLLVNSDKMDTRVAVLPASYFHPYPNCDRHSLSNYQDTRAFVESYMNSNTRAIHLWGCSWQD
mmetsp:Transcript_26388/g.57189  ORF Transcript_26388/g.57189 Transcript_26388/m.57189 type:complete len:365 (-) Transcript_26388:1751-2845(-)